jgi:hypothetical protein
VSLVQTQQDYFQSIRPLSACDAEDGRIVGRMLKDLVERKPKDLAHSVREFVCRTEMLRKCGFRFISAMLTCLLIPEDPDPEAGSDGDAPITALDRSSVTENQAIAIGRAIAQSVRRSHVPATAVRKVVNSHAVLRAMKSDFVWFVPMLEVLVAQRSVDSGRSTLMRRLSLLVKRTSVAPIGGQSDGGEDDGESGFSSVVRCP